MKDPASQYVGAQAVPRPWQGWPALNYSRSGFTQENSITSYVRQRWTSRRSKRTYIYIYHRCCLPGICGLSWYHNRCVRFIFQNSRLTIFKQHMQRVYHGNLHYTLYHVVSLLRTNITNIRPTAIKYYAVSLTQLSHWYHAKRWHPCPLVCGFTFIIYVLETIRKNDELTAWIERSHVTPHHPTAAYRLKQFA